MIYLDNAATTKPSLTAIERALKYNNDMFFNPSTLYSGGLNCSKEIRKAKDSILRSIGAMNHDVIFTSCGTESDNQAILCAVKRGSEQAKESKLIQYTISKNSSGDLEYTTSAPSSNIYKLHLKARDKSLNPDDVSLLKELLGIK